MALQPSRPIRTSRSSRHELSPPPPERGIGLEAPHFKIFVIYNTARWMYRFRLPLMKALQARGCNVYGVSPHDRYVTYLNRAGIPHLTIEMDQKGTNPLEDALLTVRLHRLFRQHRPDLVLTYTVKPNVYASLAARPLGIPVVNTIPGLGSLFVRKSIPTLIVKNLYRLALRSSYKVFFQNPDDQEEFVKNGLVRAELAEQVPGSGVDTTFFYPRPVQRNGRPFVFLFAGRLLWDKGIGELVEAARILKERGARIQCWLLGPFDVAGRTGISPEQMTAWTREGFIQYLGEVDEVRDLMQTADCVVLPSYYREGIPRTLLEAASLEKPIIAADAPGSRELVEHGQNGFLCRARDARDLAEKMHDMVQLPEEERAAMGRAGRLKVCREFDERRVVQQYVDVVSRALASNGAHHSLPGV